MEQAQLSIEEQLIRYRIEKKMAGRRDLLLHGAVYIAVAVIFLLSQPGLVNMGDLPMLGGLWTIPLLLHGLRYYYRCGPGAIHRADEIERAIDDQLERTALDEDEEVLIEDRVGKRITARRLVVAHALTSGIFFAIYVPFWSIQWAEYPGYLAHLTQLLSWLVLAFALHFSRFFFVHGRTPGGRALKIDAEVEREWHRSRERGRDRRAGFEAGESDDASAALELGDGSGRRLRLSDEGELEQLVDESVDSAQTGTRRR